MYRFLSATFLYSLIMRIATAVVLSLLLIACSDKPNDIKDMNWLVGKWEGVDLNNFRFVETWKRSDAKTLSGKGAALSNEGDTIFKEVLKIQPVEGELYYFATVPGNPEPVLFKLVEGDTAHLVFENRDHDFPQRIAYTRETRNSMSVKLEGMEKGYPKTEMLSFERAGDTLLSNK